MISAKILQVTCSSLGEIHIINTGFPKDWGFQLSTIIVSFFPSISAKSGRLAVSTSRRERTNPTRDQFQTLKLWRNWGCSQHLVNLVPRNWLEPWKQHETTRYKYCWGRLDLHHNEPRVFSKCCSFVLLATLDPTGEDLHDRCSVAISKSIMTIDVP